MTGTFPKNAGSTFFSGSQKARPPCGIPRRSFHFFGPSGFPWASQAVRGVLQDPRKFPRIVRKLEENSGSRVHRLPVFALILRSWPTSRLTRYTARNARALRARFARALRARAPRLSGAFPRIHETFPGSYGNSNKTQGPGGTGCPFRRFFRAP